MISILISFNGYNVLVNKHLTKLKPSPRKAKESSLNFQIVIREHQIRNLHIHTREEDAHL